MDTINHIEKALERLVTQFKESPNLKSYISNFLSESQNLEQVFQDLLNERWIETADGFQLNILGAIVGQSRVIIEGSIFTYFGFLGNPSSDSFGDINNASLGSPFASLDTVLTGNRSLTDDEYRLFIKARIVKNISNSTPEDIIAQYQYLFNTPQIIFEDGNTEYTISIGKKLTPNDKALINNTDIISKTAGVRVNYKASYDYNRFFGFKGVINSKGFGSTTSPDIGGYFGELI
jgi:hypothetical protein